MKKENKWFEFELINSGWLVLVVILLFGVIIGWGISTVVPDDCPVCEWCINKEVLYLNCSSCPEILVPRTCPELICNPQIVMEEKDCFVECLELIDNANELKEKVGGD